MNHALHFAHNTLRTRIKNKEREKKGVLMMVQGAKQKKRQKEIQNLNPTFSKP